MLERHFFLGSHAFAGLEPATVGCASEQRAAVNLGSNCAAALPLVQVVPRTEIAFGVNAVLGLFAWCQAPSVLVRKCPLTLLRLRDRKAATCVGI